MFLCLCASVVNELPFLGLIIKSRSTPGFFVCGSFMETCFVLSGINPGGIYEYLFVNIPSMTDRLNNNIIFYSIYYTPVTNSEFKCPCKVA